MQAGVVLPPTGENWEQDASSAKAGTAHSFVVNNTILNDGCNFGTVTQNNQIDARIAVETTIHVAEERHTAAIEQMVQAANYAHQQEMERVIRQADNALQEQANRHAWETHAASNQAMDTGEASIASSAQDARIRELELALAAHEGHVAALILEKEEASRSALARALVWATNKSEHSSNDGANYFSDGSVNSQPGALASLSVGASQLMNVFKLKGSYSDADTSAAPTAAGYEGSQSSSLHGRSLHPVDLYTIDTRAPSAPNDCASSAKAGNTRSDNGDQHKITPPIARLATTQTMTQTATIQGQESHPTPGQGNGRSSANAGDTFSQPRGGAPNDGDGGVGATTVAKTPTVPLQRKLGAPSLATLMMMIIPMNGRMQMTS